MTSDEIKALLKSTFPTLRRMFRESVYCFDPEYQDCEFQYMREVYEQAFQIVGAEYEAYLNDCDDHALDIMVETRKIHKKLGGHKVRPLGFLSGGDPRGLPHAFNFFVADGAIYITDYGRILGPDGYKPFLGIVI